MCVRLQEARYSEWPWCLTSQSIIGRIIRSCNAKSLAAAPKPLSIADLYPDRRRPRHLTILLDYPHVVITRRLSFARGPVFPVETTFSRILAWPFSVAHFAVTEHLDPCDRAGAERDHIQARLGRSHF